MDRASRSMQIDVYDFATLKKSFINLIDTKDQGLQLIDGYTFDATEKGYWLVIQTNFRHSFTADYYLYQIATKESVIRFSNSRTYFSLS
jgi:dipeptidyl-peptidase-4